MPAGGKEPEVPCAQTDRVLLPYAIAGCTGPETGSAEPSAFISPDPAVIATPSLPISYYISQGGRHFLLILLFPGWPRQNQQFHRAYHYCPPISFVSSSGPCFEPDDAPLFLASTMLTACDHSPWSWSRVPRRMDGALSMIAWPIASQVTAALEYAYDKSVIHRHRKPANAPQAQLRSCFFRGRLRTRFPVTRNTALTMAGGICDIASSPTPCSQ